MLRDELHQDANQQNFSIELHTTTNLLKSTSQYVYCIYIIRVSILNSLTR